MPDRYGDSSNNYMDYRAETNGPSGTWPVGQAYWRLFGYDGNDQIWGTRWADYIDGGNGNDRLYGYIGDDWVLGGAGTDQIWGGEGNDSLDGGVGDDTLLGENGNDTLNGGLGVDGLDGGAGADTLYGDDGNDLLFGQAGNDFLFGGYDNDVLDGGSGMDKLWGDRGNDQYNYSGVGKHVINDGVNQTGGARAESMFDTSDVILLTGASWTSQNIDYEINGSNLVIYSLPDAADGVIDNTLTIADFYKGGHYVVEFLQSSDGVQFYLGGLLNATASPTSDFLM